MKRTYLNNTAINRSSQVNIWLWVLTTYNGNFIALFKSKPQKHFHVSHKQASDT